MAINSQWQRLFQMGLLEQKKQEQRAIQVEVGEPPSFASHRSLPIFKSTTSDQD